METTGPVSISVLGSTTTTVETGTTYSDNGAQIVTSSTVEALGVRSFQNGEEVTSIDTSAAGTHQVIYKVIDGTGSIFAEATRTIIVEAAVKVPPPSEDNPIVETSATGMSN